jgi:hypothetical protein
MNLFEVGDPYIEWEETNSTQEEVPTEEYEVFDVQELCNDVVKILVAEHEFLLDDAEQAVEESVKAKPDIWNENADAKDLANFLASDGDDE